MTHTLTLHRIFAAPPERVYAAWTTPALFAQWIGPVGVPCQVIDVNPTGHGGFRLVMTMPTGKLIRIEGRFTRLTPHHHIDFTWNAAWAAMGDDPAGGLTSHANVRLRPAGLGTEMEFQHHLPDAAMVAGHEKGWTSTFDKLQHHLER